MIAKIKIAFAVLLVIFLAGFAIFKFAGSQKEEKTSIPPQTESPKIVSTKPDPLEESIVSANEIIEIVFNRPLENVGEFKSRIEPELTYKIELSGDRRTAKIIPEKPYGLGTTFTLFIGPETKFDGVGRWGQERVFHFKTIPYRGV